MGTPKMRRVGGSDLGEQLDLVAGSLGIATSGLDDLECGVNLAPVRIRLVKREFERGCVSTMSKAGTLKIRGMSPSPDITKILRTRFPEQISCSPTKPLNVLFLLLSPTKAKSKL